jgi:hypothetical protein
LFASALVPLTHSNISNEAFSKEFVYNPSVKRAVGLLLVLFIFYGTTVEAAHRHGVAAPHSNSTVSVTNPDSGTSSTSNVKPGCSDCLICQLHQNFSATLISIKLNDAAPITRVTHARRFDPVPIRSTANSPQSDRAPPQAN